MIKQSNQFVLENLIRSFIIVKKKKEKKKKTDLYFIFHFKKMEIYFHLEIMQVESVDLTQELQKI